MTQLYIVSATCKSNTAIELMVSLHCQQHSPLENVDKILNGMWLESAEVSAYLA